MTRTEVTPSSMGHDVLGPIVAEFCLRLWSIGALMDNGDDAAYLFCARGGLRMQLAYERFLSAAGLTSPTYIAPLMVSRVVAMRPALMRTVAEERDTLVPSAASTLSYEFPRSSLSEVAHAMTGAVPAGTAPWVDEPSTPDRFAALLRHPDGAPVVDALEQQSSLFVRHLRDALAGRRHAVLVDTGLYGTTQRLLTDALPTVDFSSALIALSYAPEKGKGPPKVHGLTVESVGYTPAVPRTSLLRYWHFVEWLFEPELPSVRTFHESGGAVRSNLEADGWQDRVLPTPGTAFAGVIDYLDGLSPGAANQVVPDAKRAWRQLHQAVVWPTREDGEALSVGTRSHDFGRDDSWSARPWAGPMAALRGSTMWREGEIARSGSPLRQPLLAAIEAAYVARHAKWTIARRRARA